MKQKQVKASPKFEKQIKKAFPKKKVQKPVVQSEDEEEEVVEEVKKFVNKKNFKAQKEETKNEEIEEMEPEDDDDEEEEDEDEDEDDSDEEVAEGNDDEEVDDDDEEEEEDNDDNDEAPAEKAISKEEPTLPSKIKSGPINASIPETKVIRINKLPKKCKQINIVEAFAKYGAIDQIHIQQTPTGSFANVAFKTEKAATAAVNDNEKIKVNDTIVKVSMERSKKNNKKSENYERTVFIKWNKTDISEEDLKEHFSSCGTIENITLKTKAKFAYAFVTFADKSDVPAALKLHNSLLKGVNITVENDKHNNKAIQFDERLTVMLRNKQNIESIDVAKLKTIFSKCGEIDNMVVLCKGNILAFITFKSEQSVQEAIKLSGQTEQGIELEVELYNPVKKWTSIHVSRLPHDCTVEDLTKIFSKAGEIASVQLKRNYAVIRFTDSDGYCKSFLYNESFIKGNIIFVQPHSNRMKTNEKFKKSFQNRGLKRPAQNGHSVFNPKKSKVNI